MIDPDYDKPQRYYINPKERQLFLLHLYRERIVGEVATLNAFRYRRIGYGNKPKLDERIAPQLRAYDRAFRSAIDRGDSLIKKLNEIIDDLEQNV